MSFLDDFEIAPAKSGPTGPTIELSPSAPISGPAFERDFEVAPAKIDNTDDGAYRGANLGPLARRGDKNEITRDGALGNKPGDGIWGPLKNIATGAIKGLGNSAGFVGNTANMADYVMARGQSAVTGQPIDDVLKSFAAKREEQANSPSLLTRLRSSIAPENVMPSGPDVYNPILARTGSYDPQTEGGKLAQGAINTVFGSLGPGVRGAGVGPLAATTPNLVQSIVRQAPILGATGALGEGVSDATGDPLLGVAATAALPAAVRATGGAVNRLVGQVDPHTATLAQTARNQFGIPVSAGEVSSNPTVRFLNSVVNKLPGSGGGAHKEEMQFGFNRAIANTFGEDEPAITPPVMSRARDRIGNVFENAALRTPTINLGQQHAVRLGNIIQDAQASMTPEEWTPLAHQVRNIAGLVDPQTGTITGEIYQNLTKRNSPLDRAMHSPNSSIKHGAQQIRDVLDDAFEASAHPDVVDDLRNARREWKNLRTVEPLVEKSQNGDVSPALLQGRVIANNKGTYGAAYGGGGDLKTLSDIGQRFMKEPPSSGTAERGMLMHLLGAAGGGLAGVTAGSMSLRDALLGTGAAIGAGALGRGVGAALRSDTLTDRLINRSLGNPTQTAFGNYVLNSTLPATVQGSRFLTP